MNEFVAIDFETANFRRHSICSVGMVLVEGGSIKESVYELINPEEEFDSYNIDIHGITPEDVKNAPNFFQFYNSIRKKIENKTLVAHYLPFDGYALRDNLVRYDVRPAYNNLLCTYQLSKRLLTGLSSYSLKSLCYHYNIELTKHHHALDDAKACANLFLKLIEEFELSSHENILQKANIKVGEIAPGEYRSSLVQKNRSNKSLDLNKIIANHDADEDNPIHNKKVVFTGKLTIVPRRVAAQMVAEKGGIPQNGINKETNFIVLGNFDDVMIRGEKSLKLLKAEKMINEGAQLEIISEEEFLKMIK